MIYLTSLETSAGERISADTPRSCAAGEMLQARYDFDGIKRDFSREELARAGITCVNILPTDAQPASLQHCRAAGQPAYLLDNRHEGGKLGTEVHPDAARRRR